MLLSFYASILKATIEGVDIVLWRREEEVYDRKVGEFIGFELV